MLQNSIGFSENTVEKNGISTDQIQYILGDYFQPLYEFYGTLFFDSLHYREIVFIVRRSLVLCEVFYSIYHEEVKNDPEKLAQLQYAKRKFHTDSYFLSQYRTYAEKLRNHEFPSILLVDELIIQGDSINETLYEFEQLVLSELKIPDEDLWEEEKRLYQSALGDYIKIFVAVRGDTLLLLNQRYQFSVGKKLGMKSLYDLSNRVGVLINEFDLCNSSYILGLRQKNFPHLSEENTTFYQREVTGGELDTKIYFFAPKQNLPFRGTIRVVSHKLTEEETILPLFFLPELKHHSYRILVDTVASRWTGWTKNRFPEGTPAEMESVHLFLGLSLLRIFCIERDGNDENFRNLHFDTFKIKINFNIQEQEEELLHTLLHEKVLFDKEELVFHLESILSHQNEENTNKNNSKSSKISPYHASGALAKGVEDFFYEKKSNELAYSVKKQKGFLLIQEDETSTRNFAFLRVFHQLKERYPNPQEEDEILCWILQYIDRGVLTLKARKNMDGGSSQFLRTGEGALFLYPKRYHFFNHLLAYLEETNLGDMEWMFADLKDYFTKHQDECGTIYGFTQEELEKYVVLLRRAGQIMEFWTQNLLVSGVYYEETKNRNE